MSQADSTDAKLAERLGYEETARASAALVTLVESLRNRAGLLLSVAAISSSFLGSQALDRAGATALAWLALCGFALTAALCLSVLRPRPWEFAVEAPGSLVEVVVNRREGHVQLDRALRVRKGPAGNRRAAEQLGFLLGLANVFFAIDVILWLAAFAAG